MTLPAATVDLLRSCRLCLACFEPLVVGEDFYWWSDPRMGPCRVCKRCQAIYLASSSSLRLDQWAWGRFAGKVERMRRGGMK